MPETATTILIIDDDPIIVKYLQAVFSDNGYQTCTASSSMEGLEVVRKERPDLITLDLQMPGEWGPRFYRKLRKEEELKDIPVIVISGIDGDHAVQNAVAFVSKPFDPEKNSSALGRPGFRGPGRRTMSAGTAESRSQQHSLPLAVA